MYCLDFNLLIQKLSPSAGQTQTTFIQERETCSQLLCRLFAEHYSLPPILTPDDISLTPKAAPQCWKFLHSIPSLFLVCLFWEGCIGKDTFLHWFLFFCLSVYLFTFSRTSYFNIMLIRKQLQNMTLIPFSPKLNTHFQRQSNWRGVKEEVSTCQELV